RRIGGRCRAKRCRPVKKTATRPAIFSINGKQGKISATNSPHCVESGPRDAYKTETLIDDGRWVLLSVPGREVRMPWSNQNGGGGPWGGGGDNNNGGNNNGGPWGQGPKGPRGGGQNTPP